MMKRFVFGLLALLGIFSLFCVEEGERAMIVRVGVLQPRALLPGLHVHIPVLDRILRFDVRLQTLEETASRTLTKEQKYLMVDYYVKWRIGDLGLFYRRTLGEAYRAEQIIRQKMNNTIRAAFGQRTVQEVVADDRTAMMAQLQHHLNASTQDLGVDVVDVRIKRIDLPDKVSQSVFLNMKADRERVATMHRANGQAEAEAIKAQADADATLTLAKTKATAASLRAEATSQASQLYNQTYAQQPGLFKLLQECQLYQRFQSDQTALVLSTQMPWFSSWKANDHGG